ncbi:hypothetical protein [Calidifontibacillus erzurumensis]|uniref:hypothetical protein n=1 Tax=Calidifontibacillus erzurumensis TaxID=2741433 RepID=UPI0035B53A9B
MGKKWISSAIIASLAISGVAAYQPSRSSADNVIDKLSENFKVRNVLIDQSSYIPTYDSEFNTIVFENIPSHVLDDNLLEVDMEFEGKNNKQVISAESNVISGPVKDYQTTYQDSIHLLALEIEEGQGQKVIIQTNVEYVDEEGNIQQEIFSTEYQFEDAQNEKNHSSMNEDEFLFDHKTMAVMQNSQETFITTNNVNVQEEISVGQLELLNHSSDNTKKGVLVKGNDGTPMSKVLVELYCEGSLIDVKQTDSLGTANFTGLQEGKRYKFVVQNKELSFMVEKAASSENIELEIMNHPTDPHIKGVLVTGTDERLKVKLYKYNDEDEKELIDVKTLDTNGMATFKGLEDGYYVFEVEGVTLDFEVGNVSKSGSSNKKNNVVDQERAEEIIREYVERMFEDLLEDSDFLTTYQNMQNEKQAEKERNRIALKKFIDNYSMLFKEFERNNKRRSTSNDLMYNVAYLDAKEDTEKRIERKISGYEDDKNLQEMFDEIIDAHLNFLDYSVNKIVFDDIDYSNSSDKNTDKENEDYKELYYQLLAESIKKQSQQQSINPAPPTVQQNNSVQNNSVKTQQAEKKEATKTPTAVKSATSTTNTNAQTKSGNSSSNAKTNEQTASTSIKDKVSEETKNTVKKLYEEYYRNLDEQIGDGFVDAMLGGHVKVTDLPEEKQKIFEYFTNDLEKKLKEQTGLTMVEAQQILILEGFELINVSDEALQLAKLSTTQQQEEKTEKVGVPKTGDGTVKQKEMSSTSYAGLGTLLAAFGVFFFERRKSFKN